MKRSFWGWFAVAFGLGILVGGIISTVVYEQATDKLMKDEHAWSLRQIAICDSTWEAKLNEWIRDMSVRF